MSLAVLFSGQGAQRVGMGRSLAGAFPRVAALYEEANAVLGWDLRRLSFEGPEEEIVRTAVCQPALYVHGYAAWLVLREAGRLEGWTHALGLSLGEVTALAAAGAFDFATGLRVVAERGRLMQQACEATRGTMASILGEAPEAVEALCREFDVDLANFNSPSQLVISGEVGRVQAAVEGARARGMKKVIPLNVAGAYHSRLMEPARAAFAAFLEGVDVHPPAVTVLSNTTAAPVRTPAEIRSALVRQVVSPVLWHPSMAAAAAAGVDLFCECGPGGILAGLARRTNRAWVVQSFSEAEDFAPPPPPAAAAAPGAA